MRRMLLLIVLVFVSIVAWRIADSLSSDAVGLAVGVVFGVMAGLPTALLVVANNRRSRNDEGERRQERQLSGQACYGGQPPVIVLAGPGMLPQASAPDPSTAQPDAGRMTSRPERQFHFIGVPDGSGPD